MLTKARAREDYVKAIYQLGGGEPVAAADLARYLRVSRAAVTKFRRVLALGGLVEATTGRTDLIRLTKRGQSLAVNMLRRHRLVETFLHNALRLPLDRLHAQAEAIEHVISDDVADRLERYLGNPHADPHGHPIVGISRGRRRIAKTVLSQAPAGSRIRVEDIPDHDPSVVRQLMSQRILPGLTADVIGRGVRTITLRSPRGVHRVSLNAAAAIQISLQKPEGHR